MASIKRIQAGPRLAQAVVHGDTVYLAGQVAQTNGGKSVTEQTREVLERIDALLAEAGTDKAKILSANIYIVDLKTFGEMNAVWDAWLAPGQSPARTTIQTELAAPRYAIEIAVIAAI